LSDFFLTLTHHTQLLERPTISAQILFAFRFFFDTRPVSSAFHVTFLLRSHRQELTSIPIRVSLIYIPKTLALTKWRK
jgi:hypothetical protein